MPLQTPLKTGAWDQEEDDLLYYWQSKVGNKWSEVAKRIPGRTGQQCAQRWRHKVNPNIRRDKWTDDEDAHLMDLVKTFGIGKWAEIARHMQGRTDQQCMGRWRRHLDPNIRRDSWTPEEDERLRALHQQYGTSWSRISKALKGRTSQQCRARWHQLDSGRSRRSGGGGAAAGGAGGAGGPAASAGCSSARRPSQGKRRSGTRRKQEMSDSEDDDEVDDDLTDSEIEEGLDGEGLLGDTTTLGALVGAHLAAVAPDAAAGLPPLAAAQLAAMQPLAPAAPFVGGFAAAFSCPAPGAGVAAAAPYAPLLRAATAPVGFGVDAAAMAQARGTPMTVGPAAGGRDTDGHRDDKGAVLSGRMADSVLANARRRLAARKQQEQLGCAPPLFEPLSPPRRPLGTPQRGGGGAAATSPGILSPNLMSPPGSARRLSARFDSSEPGSADGWHQLAQTQGLDEEEAAGAEVLAHLAVGSYRRDSGGLEAPAGLPLRRGGGGEFAVPGNTPTKRSPGRRPEAQLSDEPTPSPSKKPRSYTGTAGADLLRGIPDFRRRLAAAAAADGDGEEHARWPQQDQQQQQQQLPPAAVRSGGRRLTAKRSGARRSGACAVPFRAPDGTGDADNAMDDAAAESDAEPVGPVGFELDAAADLIGVGVGQQPFASPPTRATGAGAGTSGSGLGASAAAAAGAGRSDGGAAGLMSPPGRRRWGGGDASTPGKPVVNLLASPNFDRMATGCATPTAHAGSHPSPGTLALLQSPQASAMLEPFWTPYSGLAKGEPLLRSTSETPDRPSAARLKGAHVRGLFSPPSATKPQVQATLDRQAAAPAPAGTRRRRRCCSRCRRQRRRRRCRLEPPPGGAAP